MNAEYLYLATAVLAGLATGGVMGWTFGYLYGRYRFKKQLKGAATLLAEEQAKNNESINP